MIVNGKNTRMFDALIVGQGIAGSVLASQLIERGYKINVIDQGVNHSSKVAAGVINPVSGRRYAEPWRYKEMLKACLGFYPRMEKVFETQFFQPLSIGKILSTAKDKNECLNRIAINLTKNRALQTSLPSAFDKVRGDVFFLEGYWLNVALFLEQCKLLLKEKDSLIKSVFNVHKLVIESTQVNYEGCSYKAVIFCEGYHVTSNPFFKYMPWHLSKGELSEFRAYKHEMEAMVQKNKFIIPISEDALLVGSNYDREDLSLEPTLAQKESFAKFIKEISDLELKESKQKVGIRPGSRDRRPYLGRHPKENNLYLFNGFGSKGVSQAPACAQYLIDFMFNAQPLPKEMDIVRYQSFYGV